MFHDSALTEEQKLLKDLLSQLGKEFPYSYFLSAMRGGRFPSEFFKTFYELRIPALEVPEEMGGSGGTANDFAVLSYYLGWERLFSYHLLEQMVVIPLLARSLPREKKEEILNELLSGKRVVIGLLEDPTGEELYPTRTTATPHNGGYILSGEKEYLSCPDEGEYLLIPAKIQGGKGRIGIFLLSRRDFSGEILYRDLNVRVIDVREERQITGDRFGHIRFSQIFLPKEAFVGGEELYWTLLSRLFIGVGSAFLGIGDKVIEMGVNWANQRVLYTEPIGSYQAIQHPFVRAKTELEMGKLLLSRAMEVEKEGTPKEWFPYTALAKAQSVSGAFSAFDISMQAHGGSAFDRDTGILPFWTLLLFSRSYILNEDRIYSHFGKELLSQ